MGRFDNGNHLLRVAALFLVGVVLFLPNGILGGIMHLTSRWRRS